MSAARPGAAGCRSWLGACLAALLSTVPNGPVWAQGAEQALAQTPAREAPAAAGWTVQVQAPERLRLLLERNLDLVRLQKLGAEQNIGDDELKRLIDATPKQARELLQTEGYFDPQVKIERSVTSAESAPVALNVRVDPGPITRVHRVRLDFQGELAVALATAESTPTPTAESRRAATALVASLNKAWPLKAGQAFRNAQWVDGKNALLSQLRSAGYAAASLSGSAADIDASNQRASLVVVVDAGPLFRSGAVDIEGLALHERAAVLNHARFDPGTPLTETMLLDFQERLLKSGLFQQAAVTMDTDPEQAAAARLLVRVKELPANQVTTGVGYSSNSGPRVTVEYLGRRLFGLPATLRNKAEWGRKRQAWDAELSSQVGSDSYRWFSGVTVERLLTDTDTVLAQRLRLGRALEYTRIERSHYLEWDRDTRRTELASTVNEAVTFNQTMLWRDIDNPLLPTDGETLGVRLGAGQIRSNNGSGSSALGRIWARGTMYQPLGGGWFGQARLEGGQVFAKSSATVTDGLGFRAGGDNSVRGYAYRSLGPLRGGAVASGKSLLTASVEVARPISASLPTLWGAAFVDAGDAADAWRDLRPVVGAGFGLRWRSPVGPLQMDIAYGEATRRVRMHFSVGIVF